MEQPPRGNKRSSFFTFRRRMVLVRLLLREPRSSADLIAAVRAELGAESYPSAAAVALKHDFDALRNEYGCVIRYQHAGRYYRLFDLGELTLFDLPNSCLEALAFLDASFPAGSAIPEYAAIRELFERVIAMLPPERRSAAVHGADLSRLQLPAIPAERIDRATLAVVRRAIKQRRELVFEYLSNFDTDTPRRHRVAPYTVFFRPEGHGYLDATLLDAEPRSVEVIGSALHYRLDRIVAGSARVLPQILPPQRVAPPAYRLCYHLLPVVARRRDIAVYFPDTVIEYQPDGSALVRATITNLWQARQVLLRYGSACRIIAPAELVVLMRQAATELAALYNEP
ncbi:MAG TPA: WYL domain-containing protein [Roseiflexaceae bacterium]|nr:WYL domain-containing protein [Roseiflexaceae bacterium]HMP42707.1 WYL domain-containing protein [Roseiflexaceae bacterium]